MLLGKKVINIGKKVINMQEYFNNEVIISYRWWIDKSDDKIKTSNIPKLNEKALDSKDLNIKAMENILSKMKQGYRKGNMKATIHNNSKGIIHYKGCWKKEKMFQD